MANATLARQTTQKGRPPTVDRCVTPLLRQIETESAVVVDKPQEYQFTDCDLYTFYASAMLALVLLPLSILSTVCSYGDYNAEASSVAVSMLSSPV